MAELYTSLLAYAGLIGCVLILGALMLDWAGSE